MQIKHPLTGRNAPIVQVLRDIAAQEGCDGDPYDECVAAADYITPLEERLRLADSVIDKIVPSTMNQRQLLASYKRYGKKKPA